MVPKHIFQTTKHFVGLQSEIQNNMRHLRERNPNWNYRAFSDVELKRYIKENLSTDDYRQVERINPKYGVVLADLFRYLIIYQEGGVYLDIKSTCQIPLDDAIPDSATFLLSQWRNRKGQEFQGWGFHKDLGDPCFGGEFQQWHIIARPKHPLLKIAIQNTLSNIRDYSIRRIGVGMMGVLRLSGPICYTKSILSHPEITDFQRVDIQSMGFRYSVYLRPSTHSSTPSHYAKQKEPIVFDQLD